LRAKNLVAVEFMPKPKIPTPIRKWTAIKLEYLDYYLQGYVQATKSAKETHYIDPFAGCGDCIISDSGYPIQGSPWRALNAIPQFSQYHFVEKKGILAAHLQKTIFDCGFNNTHIYVGDCNDVIPREILPKIPRDVPCFTFIDPYGLQLRWETMKALASHRRNGKVELLILYPYDMAISRLFSLAKKKPAIHCRLTSFYGDESWKMQFEQSLGLGENTDQRRDRFVKLYKNKLHAIGYKYVEVYGPLYSQHRPLYHVVFASDNAVGAKIMGDVWAKTRFIPGELGYVQVRRPKTPK
jgi:three-Cys-motif partner protein